MKALIKTVLLCCLLVAAGLPLPGLSTGGVCVSVAHALRGEDLQSLQRFAEQRGWRLDVLGDRVCVEFADADAARDGLADLSAWRRARAEATGGNTPALPPVRPAAAATAAGVEWLVVPPTAEDGALRWLARNRLNRSVTNHRLGECAINSDHPASIACPRVGYSAISLGRLPGGRLRGLPGLRGPPRTAFTSADLL